jgi:hypothetical protein
MPLAGGRRSRVRAHCAGSTVSSGEVTVSCCGFAADTSSVRAAPDPIPHRQGPTFESRLIQYWLCGTLIQARRTQSSCSDAVVPE